jgi:hypothetical protein
MKQGQVEWGREGVMDRILGHLSFKEFVLAGTDISPTKNRTISGKKNT